MNERIEELLTQSGYDARYCSEDFDPEKFAELIVMKCADIACEHMELNEGTDYNIGSKIKQHFGVKE